MVHAFFRAVRAGDRGTVGRLLETDPSLVHAHDAGCFGATALGHAVNAGDFAMVDLLLTAGADPNAASDWWAGGFRPLDSASAEMADHLVSRGAEMTAHAAARLGRRAELQRLLELNPALVRARGGDGQLPLHYAATPEIAALLLGHGAELDARDVDHASTAAQYAASERPAVAAWLVSQGAHADVFLAAMLDDVVLLEKVAAAEPGGVRACATGARVTAERFPAPGSQALGIYHYTVGTGCTLLHAAAIADAAQACRWLIKQGADPDARGGYDDGAPLHQAAWNNRAAAAAALLDGGATIDLRSGRLHDNTPLGWAIVAGSVEVVDLLVKRGAAVLAHHRTDAESGVAGKFTAFKRGQALDNWVRVKQLVDCSSRSV